MTSSHCERLWGPWPSRSRPLSHHWHLKNSCQICQARFDPYTVLKCSAFLWYHTDLKAFCNYSSIVWNSDKVIVPWFMTGYSRRWALICENTLQKIFHLFWYRDLHRKLSWFLPCLHPSHRFYDSSDVHSLRLHEILSTFDLSGFTGLYKNFLSICNVDRDRNYKNSYRCQLDKNEWENQVDKVVNRLL